MGAEERLVLSCTEVHQCPTNNDHCSISLERESRDKCKDVEPATIFVSYP